MELIPAQAPVEAPETILAPVATPTVSQNFFCGTWTKGTAEYIAIGTSSFAYLLLTAFASFVVFRSVQTHRRTVSLDGSHSSPQKGWKLRLTICILLLLGLIRTPSPKKVVRSVRLPWNILNIIPGNIAYTAFWLIGRIAACTNIFAFSIVGTLWLSIGHHARDPPKMRQSRFDRINLIACIVFNASVLIYAIITVALGPNDGPGVPAFEAHVIIISTLQALTMLFFIVYGVVLSCLVRRAGAIAHYSNAKSRKGSHAARITRVAALYSFCFLLKAFAFSYRIITSGCFFPHWFFWTIGYYLPEMIVTSHLLWSYFSIDRKIRQDRLDSYNQARQGRVAANKASSPSTSQLSSPSYSSSIYSSGSSSADNDSRLIPLLSEDSDADMSLKEDDQLADNAFVYASKNLDIDFETSEDEGGFDGNFRTFANGSRARTMPLPFEPLRISSDDDPILATSLS